MWKNHDLKEKGKMALKANYWLGVLAVLLVALCGVCGTLITSDNGVFGALTVKLENVLEGFYIPYFAYGFSLGSIILSAIFVIIGMLLICAAIVVFAIFFEIPLEVGVYKYFIDSNNGNADAGNIMYSFKKGRYSSIVKSVFLAGLFEVLWGLLFIVPGIIKAYQWRLVPYIMVENPSLSPKEARDLSAKLMKGNCWHAFGFDLSFLGWHLLSLLTCGILYLFWTLPFIMHSDAALYQTLVNADKAAACEDSNDKQSAPDVSPAVEKLEENKQN